MTNSIPTIEATTIGIDFRANALTVSASVSSGSHDGEEFADIATIDIGTRGRLLAIDLEDPAGDPLLTVSIDEPTATDRAIMRSARISVRVASGAETLSIVFSRHGETYDISWPSGNQCWRRGTNGPDGTPRVTCAVVTS
ncbi:MAG: hypothetical protein QM753_18550 [Thermomicrobiales bacterium]